MGKLLKCHINFMMLYLFKKLERYSTNNIIFTCRLQLLVNYLIHLLTLHAYRYILILYAESSCLSS